MTEFSMILPQTHEAEMEFVEIPRTSIRASHWVHGRSAAGCGAAATNARLSKPFTRPCTAAPTAEPTEPPPAPQNEDARIRFKVEFSRMVAIEFPAMAYDKKEFLHALEHEV
jgi:hypothetical protein